MLWIKIMQFNVNFNMKNEIKIHFHSYEIYCTMLLLILFDHVTVIQHLSIVYTSNLLTKIKRKESDLIIIIGLEKVIKGKR